MKRLAILDHEAHVLFVEDVDDEMLEGYDGEEEYIEDNYVFQGEYSWEWITEAEYIPMDCGYDAPFEINFKNIID